METSQHKLQLKELKLPVPWGHIAAKAWGSPTDKHVLVVHGILDNAGSFDRLIALLPNFYYYVCIDLPGHGLSSHFPSGIPLDYFAYVLTIRTVLDVLEWNKCIYIGHSFGGMLGIYFSALYPMRIEKLISIDAVIPPVVPNENILSQLKQVYETVLQHNSNRTPQLHSKDEVLHALMFKRSAALNLEAAKCTFERAVTKVGNAYKYNRDPRARIGIKPLMNFIQHMEFITKLQTPLLIIVASSAAASSVLTNVQETIKTMKNSKIINENIQMIVVEGNHDVHNNYPERVAPHIWGYLVNSNKSKL